MNLGNSCMNRFCFKSNYSNYVFGMGAVTAYKTLLGTEINRSGIGQSGSIFWQETDIRKIASQIFVYTKSGTCIYTQ